MRVKVFLSVVVAALMGAAVLGGVSPAGAIDRPVPDGCEFDPALNGNGVATLPIVSDGTDPIDLDVDAKLRVVTLSTITSGSEGDPTFEFRVRRYLTDGSPDLAFGEAGVADLPGSTRTTENADISVGEDGQIWVTRAGAQGTVDVLALTDAGDLRLGKGEVVLGDVTGELLASHATIEGANGYAIVSVQLGLHLEVMVLSQAGEVLTSVETSDLNAFAIEVHEIDPYASLLVGGVLDRDQDVWFPMVFAYDDQPEPVIDYSAPGVYSAVTSRNLTTATVTGWFAADEGRSLLMRDLAFDQWLNLESTTAIDVASASTGEAGVMFSSRGAVVSQVEDAGQTVAALSWRMLDVSAVEVAHEQVDPLTPWAVRDTFVDEPTVIAGFGVDRATIVLLQLTPSLGEAPAATSLPDHVSRLYQTVYGRSPDAGGLAFWARQRASGVSAVDMAISLLDSAEFRTAGNLTTIEFVELITGHASLVTDDVTLAFFAGQIDGGTMTRAEFVVFMADGSELVDATATIGAHTAEEGSAHRLYRAYFLRNPDALGLCYWSRLLVGGESLREVSDFFASSDEFDALYGDLTDRQFVELVYQNVLGRPGEPEGVEFWSAELWSGRQTRGEVMVGFSESPEFILLTGTLPPG